MIRGGIFSFTTRVATTLNLIAQGGLVGGALMTDETHHMLKVNGDKSRASAVAVSMGGSGNHQHHDSLHQHHQQQQQQQHDSSGLPGMLHQHGEDALDSLAADSESVIPTPVAQHGMVMCDDRYDKYKYDKYDPGMEFNALSQRYLAGDVNIGGQGQLLGSAIGIHGFKDATAYSLAPHPFSIQRLLPGPADAKSDVKMFDMVPYGGYATLASAGHGESSNNLYT